MTQDVLCDLRSLLATHDRRMREPLEARIHQLEDENAALLRQAANQARSAAGPRPYSRGDLLLALEPFVGAMEDKMLTVAQKGTWRSYEANRLFARIEEELGELKAAVYRWRQDRSPRNLAAVRSELVDLANTCMMAWDRFGLALEEAS